MDLIQLHGRGLEQMGQLVAGVKGDHMTLPTPCEGWDVKELLNHVVGGNRLYAGIARRSYQRRAPGEDLVGSDPRGAYQRTADDMRQAWSDPALLDTVLPTHLGDLPGRAVLNIHLIELVAHGWDLARATGQRPSFDPDVVNAALEAARRALGQIPRGAYFQSEVEVESDRPEIERLAAFLGRRI